MEDNTVELIDYIRVIWRQKWIIIATVAVAMVTAWLMSEVPDPTYRATTTLLPMPSLASELAAGDVGADFPVAAYGEMAMSTPVLQALHDAMGESLTWSLDKLRSRLSVTVEPLSAGGDTTSRQAVLLKFSITGTSPNDLDTIAQAWIVAFRSVYGSTFQDRASRSFDYIQESLDLTTTEIARVTSERLELLSEHPISLLEARSNSLTVRLKSALAELQDVILESETLAAFSQSGEWPSREVRSDVALLSDVSPYTIAGATILGLSERELAALLAARQDILEREIAALEEELVALQTEIDTANADISLLDRELALLNSTASFLSSKLQDIELALAETQDPIMILDAPSVSKAPIAPKKMTNMLVAGVLGLLLGTLLAFFIDYLRRVHDRENRVQPQPAETTPAPATVDRNGRRSNETSGSDSSEHTS